MAGDAVPGRVFHSIRLAPNGANYPRLREHRMAKEGSPASRRPSSTEALQHALSKWTGADESDCLPTVDFAGDWP
jgi:hypothetical protein